MMKLKERLNEMNYMQIDGAFVKEIEDLYKVQLSNEVQKIVSLSQDTTFYDDKPILRGLSNTEIINATADLEVDFVAHALLPIFDIGDNDFVVFDFSENCWCLFNIVDEIKFRKTKDLINVLNIKD